MDRDRDETLIAQGLDAFLVVQLSDRNTPRNTPLPLDVPLAEATVAAELVELAETIQPDLAFGADLEARLSRHQPLRWWRQSFARFGQDVAGAARKHRALSQAVAILAAGGMVAVLIFAVMPQLAPRQGLSRLPTLAAMAGYPYGRVTTTRNQVFPDTEFVLSTTLPSAPSRATVFWHSAPKLPTVEETRRWARLFGLEGQAYVGSSKALNPNATPAQVPDVYFTLMDGLRQVLLSSYWVAYGDGDRRPLPGITTTLPFTQAAPIAQDFMRARGLLDFPFRAEPCPPWSLSPQMQDTVCFVRLTDGRPVYYSETSTDIIISPPNVVAMAGVVTSGQTWWMAYRLTSLRPGDKYPIRSAQEAWQALVSGQPGNQVQYIINSQWQSFPVSSVKYWSPKYRPGERADLYGLPTVLRPAEGGDPIIIMNGVRLSGSQDDLEYISKMGFGGSGLLHVWGIMRQGSSNQQILEMAGWEVPTDLYSFTGMIKLEGDLVLLRRSDTQVFLLSNPPDDLASGLMVRGYGQNASRTEDGYPVLDWTYLQSPPDTTPTPPEGWITQSSGKAYVEQAELVYYVPPQVNIPGAATATPGSEALPVQPMWRFTGRTENGSSFEVLVQAIRDEYLLK